MKIIVLTKTEYKEKDIIINAINENELISFKVRGAQVSTSPFYWLNTPLTIADVEFIDNPRYQSKILKNAKLIYTPVSSGDSYSNYLAINFINEAINKGLDDNEKHKMFSEIENFFLENKGNEDLILSEVVFLIKLASIAGFGLNADGCIKCGSSSDIVAFSFLEGGFLCRKHFEEDMVVDFSGKDLKLIHYLTNVKHYSSLINDHANERVNKETKRSLLAKFAAFIDETLGAHINSVDLILKI